MYSTTRQGWLWTPLLLWQCYDIILLSDSHFFLNKKAMTTPTWESPRWLSLTQVLFLLYRSTVSLFSSKADLNGIGKYCSVRYLRDRCRTLLWPRRRGQVCAADFWGGLYSFFQASLTHLFLPALSLLPRITNLHPQDRLWMKPTTKKSREDTSKDPGDVSGHLSLNQPILKPALEWVSCSWQ